MASRNKMSRQQRMKEKAQTLFYVYYQMGAERTLSRLSEICDAIRVRACVSTLEKYSVEYEWQRQILELDNRASEDREAEAVRTIQQMNDRHAQIHQAFLNLGVAGIRHLQDNLRAKREAQKPETLDLSIQDIARILDQSQKGERLARGEATSRTEVMIEVISVFVKEFALIFLGVNTIQDEEQRKAEYLKRCDSMLRDVYPAARAGKLALLK